MLWYNHCCTKAPSTQGTTKYSDWTKTKLMVKIWNMIYWLLWFVGLCDAWSMDILCIKRRVIHSNDAIVVWMCCVVLWIYVINVVLYFLGCCDFCDIVIFGWWTCLCSNRKQEAQLMLTNLHDVFRGQSRSPNMVPFDVKCGFLLVFYRNCPYDAPFLRYLTFKYTVTLKTRLGVTQGHPNRHIWRNY